MADFKAIDMMNKCNQSEPEVVMSWFTVNFIKNNKKPKILSHFEVPYEDKKFVQVCFFGIFNLSCRVISDHDFNRESVSLQFTLKH